jgi:hypothetical protein
MLHALLTMICCCLQASFVEIYNEVIQDLLAPAPLAPSGSNGNLVAARAVYGGSSSNGNGNGSSGGGGMSPRRPTASTSEYGFGSLGASSPRRLSRSVGDGADVSVSAGSGSGGGSIVIYENGDGQIVLDGATEVVLQSAADLAALLLKGSTVRATASHK